MKTILIAWFVVAHHVGAAPCKVKLSDYSTSIITGTLRCHGDDGPQHLHRVQLSFDIGQNSESAYLHLYSNDYPTLAIFGVENGEIKTSKILGQKEPDAKTMVQLQGTNEFKALPALAALLGHDYNVTAKTWPVSILLFRMAMSSEMLHKTEEQADFYLNQKYPSRVQYHQLTKRSLSDKIVNFENMAGKFVRQLNPWTFDPDDEILCASPDGICDYRIETKNISSCSGLGQPLHQNDIQVGCMGLCGPSCFRCWSYICGDCCKHPGCYSHDSKCLEGYLTLECITGKGLIWGDNSDTC
ncbi:uncharacterized protein LOC134819167 isoform X1 [Bolinopsis microptera]|uniref:uncharacterized protein LOC134819167 isoform X1 n=1 Tax=Bolinopsis microptera TaxID=2820187 RepID=UPI0030796BC6